MYTLEAMFILQSCRSKDMKPIKGVLHVKEGVIRKSDYKVGDILMKGV